LAAAYMMYATMRNTVWLFGRLTYVSF